MSVLLAEITLRTSVKYVAAAYAVVWAVTLLYVWIIGAKLGRMERELEEAERRLADRRAQEHAARDERLTV